jgi:WD40 repeat protein
MWDARTGVQLGRPLTHDGDVTYVQFSPDRRRIATASRDKTVRVWDAASGLPIVEPLRHDVPVLQVRFQPDGKQLLARTANAACIWDVPDFPTPPPGWLANLADTLSLAELPSDSSNALSLIAVYERTRDEALSTPGDGAYARLAHRLFSKNAVLP